MSSSASPADSRVRKVAFWKKHQTILQNCADLSNLCGMKILVSIPYYFHQSSHPRPDEVRHRSVS